MPKKKIERLPEVKAGVRIKVNPMLVSIQPLTLATKGRPTLASKGSPTLTIRTSPEET